MFGLALAALLVQLAEASEPQLARLVRDATLQEKKKPSKSKGDLSFRKECLEAHNQWRRLHNVPELKIDPKLTKFAQSRADFIAASDGDKFEHVKETPYGENLAWHSNEKSDCNKLTAMWYDEISDYNFFKPSFNMTTGHFTQMIWRDTTRVGCARQISTGSQGGVYLVCNYDPPGNFVGEFAQNVLPMISKLLPNITGLMPTFMTSTERSIIELMPTTGSSSSSRTGLATSTSSTTTSTAKPATAKPKLTKKKKNKNKSKNKKRNKNKKDDKRKKGNKKSNKKNKNKKKQHDALTSTEAYPTTTTTTLATG